MVVQHATTVGFRVAPCKTDAVRTGPPGRHVRVCACGEEAAWLMNDDGWGGSDAGLAGPRGGEQGANITQKRLRSCLTALRRKPQPLLGPERSQHHGCRTRGWRLAQRQEICMLKWACDRGLMTWLASFCILVVFREQNNSFLLSVGFLKLWAITVFSSAEATSPKNSNEVQVWCFVLGFFLTWKPNVPD